MGKAYRLKTRSNSAFRLIYHLVLVTKFRHDTLTGEMIERLEDIFDLTLSKWDCELIEFGGEGNHIHVLFEAIPSVNLSKLVNNLKTVSSRLMRKEYSAHLKQFYWAEKPMFWGGSYALITVGAQAPLAKLIEYVQNQEKPE
jgi:putative transposase